MRLLLALVVVVGCKSSPSKSPVDLRPLTITFDGKPIAKLYADGHTEAAGPNAPGGALVPGPTLRADGTIVLTKGGYTARVEPDGEINILAPTKHHFGRITQNRLDLGTRGIRVEGATIAYESGPDSVIGRIEGTIDDRNRHTALVMTAAFLIDMSITP